MHPQDNSEKAQAEAAEKAQAEVEDFYKLLGKSLNLQSDRAKEEVESAVKKGR